MANERRKRGRPPHPDILTPREWQVLALLRERLTNEQIASRLDISPATAKYHVSEILSKLGVTTREEAAAWQPPAELRWWERIAAPLAAMLRRLGALTPAKAVIASAAVATLIACALLVWALLRASNEGGDAAVQMPATPSEPPSIDAVLQRGLWTFPVDGGEPAYILPIEGLTGRSFGDTYQLSPDGRWFAVARQTVDGSEVIVGTTSGGDRHAFALELDAYVAAVSPGGATLLIEGTDDLLTRTYFLDVATGQLTDIGPKWQGGAYASWSPDGRHLLLVGSPDEASPSGAYITDSAAGGARLLLEGAFTRAIWAPDGRAFATVLQEPRHLVLADTNGTVLRSVPYAGDLRNPVAAWSQDAQKLAYVGHFGGLVTPGPDNATTLDQAWSAVYVMNVETGEERKIARGVQPAWSPQGDRLAFISGGDLYVASAEGRHVRRLTTQIQPSLYLPYWVDSSTVLAAYAPRISESIYEVNTRTGLKAHLLDGHSPSWSPDGEMIAFVGDSSGGGLGGTDAVYIANGDGTDLRTIGWYDWSDVGGCPGWFHLSWSSDGSYIAFKHPTDPMGPTLTLLAVRPAERPPRAGDGCTPSWSPQGMKLAYGSLWSDQRGYSLEVFDLETGAPSLSLQQEHPVQSPVWSPDGTRIAYLRQSDVVVVNEDGTGERVVKRLPCSGDIQHSRWSPDGRSLIVSVCDVPANPGPIVESKPPIIARIDLETGEEREIARGWYAQWSPDGQTIAYTSHTAGPESAVYLVAASGGEPRYLASGWAPVWSPDGTTLLVTSHVP